MRSSSIPKEKRATRVGISARVPARRRDGRRVAPLSLGPQPPPGPVPIPPLRRLESPRKPNLSKVAYLISTGRGVEILGFNRLYEQPPRRRVRGIQKSRIQTRFSPRGAVGGDSHATKGVLC